ncbi:restriction endonuclease subunit S [Aeromonas hydrophila]|uniref:restriction endonuclease subunit S n=1 Tax=Aeromonas hydrophila TaxID=644 RepID=UPI002B48D349|nr:restriction endonuclease subunit S [Aeromonas hydrophila]
MANQMMQDKASEMAATQTVPTGYKQTEVGVIPEDWECKHIGELADVVRGGSPRPAGDARFFNGNFIPWLTVASLTNISLEQMYVVDTATKLTELGSLRSRVLNEDTLIISNSGATLGVAKILKIKCCANDGVAALVNQCLGNKVFLAHYINTQTKKLQEQIATGNGQPNLNTDLIRVIPVPFPREAEQAAIANVLSDTDALIAGLEQLIAKKQAIKTAAMQQLLTGRTRLPQFALRSDGTPKGYKTSELGQIPEDWEIMPLVSIGRTIRGVSYNPNNDLYISDSSDSIRLFRSNNILNSRFVFSGLQYVSKNRVSESQKMQLGDILICMANGSKSLVGKSAIHDLNDGYEYTFGAFMGVFRLNDASQSKYVYYLMNSARYRCYIDLILAGSSINNLKPSDIDKLSLAFPDIEEQTAIAAMLSDMDSELAALEQKLAKARDVKQGMMQQLLTGRIRLPLEVQA